MKHTDSLRMPVYSADNAMLCAITSQLCPPLRRMNSQAHAHAHAPIPINKKSSTVPLPFLFPSPTHPTQVTGSRLVPPSTPCPVVDNDAEKEGWTSFIPPRASNGGLSLCRSQVSQYLRGRPRFLSLLLPTSEARTLYTVSGTCFPAGTPSGRDPDACRRTSGRPSP